MKVIKNKEVTTNVETTIDAVKVAELKENFDLVQSQLNNKEYDITLTEEQTSFLFTDVYENIVWKGYESYAISETHDTLHKLVKDGKLVGKTRTEIVEAIFHFLKNYNASGVKSARLFRQVCDQFALPMTEINNDRQTLRDLSLELVSVEQGIPVEELIAGLQREQQEYQG
jgi:hypothetical protein